MNRLLALMFAVVLNSLSDLNALAQTEINGDLLDLYEPISNDIKAEVRHQKITRVYVNEKADGHVFDNPRLFPRLREVTLNVDSTTNNELLHSLATNYPNLQAIHIAQKQALSADSLQLIHSFKDLTYLGLACDLANPAMFTQSAPTTLVELNLFNSSKATTWKFPPLPQLQTLRIDGPVTAEFLQSLQSPNLEYLNMDDGVDDKAIAEIARFKHLQHLIMQRTAISEENERFLHTLGITQIVCRHK